MAAVFSNATKRMLKNVLNHTNCHNKTVEEAEMWQQRDRMKELGGLDPNNPSYGHDDRCDTRNRRGGRRYDYWNSKSRKPDYLSTSSRARRAHMDEEEEMKGRGGNSTSTYWMRQLEKLETSDPNRWDHSGYRELYPNDFKSDRSDSDSDRSSFVSRHRPKGRRANVKKKYRRSISKERRQKKKRPSHRHGKRSKRKQPSVSEDSSSYSDSESSDSSPSPYRRQPHTEKSRHYDRTKSQRHVSSVSRSSSSSVGSESDSSERPYSQKHRKRARDSSTSSTYSSDSVSSRSPERKKVKVHKSKHLKKTKNQRKLQKHKRKSSRHKIVVKKEQEEDRRVVQMWKEANGHDGSSKNSDFDRRVRREISNQYQNLKRRHIQERSGQDRKRQNGNSSFKSKRRRHHESSSSSSDSDQ